MMRSAATASAVSPRTISFTFVALSVVFLLGCAKEGTAPTAAGDSQPTTVTSPPTPAKTADADPIDACSFVTLADAESILGTPAKLSAQAHKDSLSCNYESTDQTHGVNNLGVKIEPQQDASEAKSYMEVNKNVWGRNTSRKYEVLPGTGDDAFLTVNKQPDVGADAPAMIVDALPDQQLLIVLKGTRVISLMTNYMGKPRPTDSLKALAIKVADHS